MAVRLDVVVVMYAIVVVVPMFMVVAVVMPGGPGGMTPAQLADQHPRADRHDAGRRQEWRRSHDEVRAEQALRADDHRGKGEDSERVRGAHRQPEADRVHGRPARADQVGGHQRLAMARGQGVRCPQARGRRQREQQHEGRQVGSLEQGRDLAADAAGNGRQGTRALDRGGIGGCGFDRTRVGDGDRWELRPSGRHGDDHALVGEGVVEPISRVRLEPVRDAAVAQLALDRRDRHPRAFDHDLAPAEPPGVRGVRELDVRARRNRCREAGLEDAHETERRQAANARAELDAGGRQLRLHRRALDGEVQVVGQRSAGRHATRLQLGVRDLPVLVRVECLTRLERRDLGLVDDEIEGDAVGFDAQSRVVVDREIAERVGEHDRRQHDEGQHCERESAAGDAHQCRSAWYSSLASGAQGQRLRHLRPGLIGAAVREERPGEGIVAVDVVPGDELGLREAQGTSRVLTVGRHATDLQELHPVADGRGVW